MISRLSSVRSAELMVIMVSSLLDSTPISHPKPWEALLECSYILTDSKANSNLLDNKKFDIVSLVMCVHVKNQNISLSFGE